MLKACIFNQSDSHKWVSLIFDWMILVNAGIFFYVHFEVVYMIVQTILFLLSVTKKKEKFIVTIEEMDVLF